MGLVEPQPNLALTTVRCSLTTPSSPGVLVPGRWIFTPTRRLVASDRVVAPQPIIAIPTSDELAQGWFTLDLLATDTGQYGAGWGWTVIEPHPGITRTVQVPTSTSVVEYAALPSIDPATLDPIAQPEPAVVAVLRDLARRVAEVEAGVADPSPIGTSDAAIDGYLTELLGDYA